MKIKKSFTLNELIRQTDAYFAEYLPASEGEIPDIESLCEYLGTDRERLTALEGDEKLGIVVARAKNRIAMMKKQLAFRGKIPATIFCFDMKNNHGYEKKPKDEPAEFRFELDETLEEWGG